MYNSPDPESRNMVHSVAKVFIKEGLVKALNEGQGSVFEGALDYFSDSDIDALIIKGYAGTGKTFLVRKLIEYILQTDEQSKIAILAPTNKAVKVLYKGSANNKTGQKVYMFDDVFDSDSRIVYSTVHKMLALREVIKDNGEQVFEADTWGAADISEYTHFFIDEGFMVSDKLCAELISNTPGAKIIFLGDPAQVPPIGKAESVLLEQQSAFKFKQLELTEIMRQKGDNAIIKNSFLIRENLLVHNPIPNLYTELNANGEGVIHVDAITERNEIYKIIERYVKDLAFKEDPDFFKILTWKRETSDYINGIAREIMYGKDTPRFVVGERLLTTKPVLEKFQKKYGKKSYINWRVTMSNSEELTVEQIALGEIRVTEDFPVQIYKCYDLTVSYLDPFDNQIIRKVIKVLHEDSRPECYAKMDEMHKLALQGIHKGNWVKYYNFLKYFAYVDYNYALTVHRAQGSTYENVLVLEEDIDKNFKIKERNRIKYTAYTRASKRLYVLKRNESPKQIYKDYRTEDYTSCGPT